MDPARKHGNSALSGSPSTPFVLPQSIDPPAPRAVLGNTEWPPSIPGQVRALLHSFAAVIEASKITGEDSALVSLQDLESLEYGLRWLDHKTSAMYTNLVNMSKPKTKKGKKEKADAEDEPWYINEVQEDEGSGAPDTAQERAKMKDTASTELEKSSGAVSSRPSKFDESRNLTTQTSTVHAPYMKNLNDTAQPSASTPLATAFDAQVLASASSVTKSKSSDHELEFSNGNARSRSVIMTNTINKRNHSRSLERGPIKKKLKFLKEQEDSKDPNLKKPINGHTLWSGAARTALRATQPGLKKDGLKELLMINWKAMTKEERQPFNDLAGQDVQRYHRQEQILKTGGQLDLDQDRKDRADLRAAAEEAFQGLRIQTTTSKAALAAPALNSSSTESSAPVSISTVEHPPEASTPAPPAVLQRTTATPTSARYYARPLTTRRSGVRPVFYTPTRLSNPTVLSGPTNVPGPTPLSAYHARSNPPPHSTSENMPVLDESGRRMHKLNEDLHAAIARSETFIDQNSSRH